MVINRRRYLDKLISRMNNGMIKVITGIRRCGKSYLLFEIFYNYLIEQGVPQENIITVPLDDEEYVEYTDPHKLYDYIKSRLVDGKMRIVWIIRTEGRIDHMVYTSFSFA